MKIKSMTEEQEKAMYEYREKQRLRGVACGRADREKVTRAINFFYEKLGKKKPIVWICDSPYMAQIWINIFKGNLGSNLLLNLQSNLWSNLTSNLLSNLESNLGANLESNLGANLRSNLQSNLQSNLLSNLGSNLGSNLQSNLTSNLLSNLESNLGSNLGANLRSNLESNLLSNLESNLGANLKKTIEYIGASFYGQMDLYWTSFYAFPHLNLKKMHNDEDFEKLQAWEDMAESGFWYPFENIVFVSDRFKTLHQDSENRLHHESEMAMSFWDGYGFYSWHGVQVSEKIIKKQFTVDDINKEENAEVRRAMTEIMGAEEYIKKSKAKVIHKCEAGILYRSEVHGDEPIVMVAVDNSTPEGKWIGRAGWYKGDRFIHNNENQGFDETLVYKMGDRFIPDLDSKGKPIVKKYWLRVPPNIENVNEALAWTFGLEKNKYKPMVET